jgi:hypothetical protein
MIRLTQDQIEALEPLTRQSKAFIALQDLIGEIVGRKKAQHEQSAIAALVNPDARGVGLIAMGEHAQAKEIQNLLTQISGKRNTNEDKDNGNK